ncbi:MAG: UDP-2,4-diacetamido-2,4,6-trideoxy-beta-L-altropyranose hydrolase, partial [Hydrogenobaculum sp.]
MKVFIITEGSSYIGFGHITRMLSIYQAFEEINIKPKLIINGDESILDLVENTDFEIYDWLHEKENLLSQIKDADIVIVDSYMADKDFYEKISNMVKIPVYYDDNKRLDYPKGIVVNGNIYAKDLDYPNKEGTFYLLGTQYTPLRKEFWEVSEKSIKKSVESIMITFGGDDIRNMTPKVLKLLKAKFPNLKKNVVIGKGFKNINEIEYTKDANTDLIYFPKAEKMKELMLESDIAISAGGQTLYE